MIYFFYIVLFVFAIYTILIIWFLSGIRKLEYFKPKKITSSEQFSIVIVFRDEEKNLPELLQSIIKLRYPRELFEVLLINDESADGSEKIVQSFVAENPTLNTQLHQNVRKSNAPKKDGIELGVGMSRFEWIFSTDADCAFSENHLDIINSFILEKNPFLIAGMVQIQSNNSLLHQFQQLDWMSLTGFTESGFGWKNPMICSGAHLIYKKSVFQELGGFRGNEKFTSGDDVFLLQKMQEKYPEKVHYLLNNETIVYTKPLNDWSAVFEQHKRWMAKTGSMSHFGMKLIGIIVLLANLVVILCAIAAIFNIVFFYFFAFLLSYKIVLDYFYLSKVAIQMKEKIQVKYFLISQLIYPFFSLLVSLFGLTVGFKWKERKYLK